MQRENYRNIYLKRRAAQQRAMEWLVKQFPSNKQDDGKEKYIIALTKDEIFTLSVLLFFVDPDILEDEDNTRPFRDKLQNQITEMICAKAKESAHHEKNIS